MTYRTRGSLAPAAPRDAVTLPPPIPADRARVRDALRVLAYAVEQGWAITRPTMVEVFAADLATVERRWLLDGIGPTQTRTGLIAGRVTVEGTLIGRLIRVHLPSAAGA